jgi:hypothetical protein
MALITSSNDKELAGLAVDASDQLAAKGISVSPDVILAQWLHENSYPNLGGVQVNVSTSQEGMQAYVNTLASDLKSGQYSGNNVTDFVSKLQAENYCTENCGSFYIPQSSDFAANWNSMLTQARTILTANVGGTTGTTPGQTSIPTWKQWLEWAGKEWNGEDTTGKFLAVPSPSTTLNNVGNAVNNAEQGFSVSGLIGGLRNIGVIVLGGVAIIIAVVLVVWQSPAQKVKQAVKGE